MENRSLQFWYEFASTYSYVASARIQRVAGAANVELDWRAFLLGPIFAEQGWKDSPFNLYPAKGRYMWRDMERLCEAEDLPLVRPSQFPRNGLLAARVALLAEAEGWVAELTPTVFRANFAEDRDISVWETIAEILVDLGRDAEAIYEQALAPTNKDALKARTEEAASLGIFGAPSFVVGKELFWGNDRLEAALAWAGRADVD